MAQFVTLTLAATAEKIRVNVEAIVHYIRDASDKNTDVVLSNGGLLNVQESMPAIDDLIRDNDSIAVLSANN